MWIISNSDVHIQWNSCQGSLHHIQPWQVLCVIALYHGPVLLGLISSISHQNGVCMHFEWIVPVKNYRLFAANCIFICQNHESIDHTLTRLWQGCHKFLVTCSKLVFLCGWTTTGNFTCNIKVKFWVNFQFTLSRTSSNALPPSIFEHKLILFENTIHKCALQITLKSCLLILSQEEYDDEDDWNPCKAAGVCLMLLAQCCENDVIPFVTDFIMENIKHQDWKNRDAAVMAFGECTVNFWKKQPDWSSKGHYFEN